MRTLIKVLGKYFLYCIPIFIFVVAMHETLHVGFALQRNETIREVCFMGYNGRTIGWVDNVVGYNEFPEEIILGIATLIGFVLLSWIGVRKIIAENDRA